MKVVLKEQKTYDIDSVRGVILAALTEIGFDFTKIKGARVAIKPNLLTSVSPETGVVTHPTVFAALVRLIKQSGGIPVLVESPAIQSLNKVMRKTGYEAIVTEEGVYVADTSECVILYNENARVFKRFEVPKILTECDILINLPKFKTHALTHITCAVKNLFGTIHGTKKSQWHIKATTKYEFAEMLLDLYEAFIISPSMPKTMVHIVDAVTMLEGDGPGPKGKPKYMGVVGVSDNAIAVDYALADTAGFARKNIPTITMGVRRNLCGPLEDIIVSKDKGIGANYHCIPPKESGSSKILGMPLVNTVLKNWFLAKPVPDDNCTLCYQCRQICPADAIGIAQHGSKVPAYNYSKCIRCYCCIEICPESALSLSKPLLSRIF